MKNLRDYQVEAVEAIRQENIGQIILPTGTGKSIIMQTAVAEQCELDASSVVVLHYPRISLLSEQAQKLATFLSTRVNDFEIVSFHSGNEKVTWDIIDQSTGYHFGAESGSFTDYNTLCDTLINTRRKPIIILSTYHSAPKVQWALKSLDIKPALELNDESQFLTQECFNIVALESQAVKRFYFTATPTETESNEGRGMNNVLLYGNVLVTRSVKQMVEEGYITPIRPYEIKKVVDSGMKADSTAAIVTAFEALRKDKKSGNGAKLIVFAKSLDDIREFNESDERRKLIASGVTVASIGSGDDVTYVNHTPTRRDTFMDTMHEAGKATKDMIILNYDILSEGIDVPGFNGVLILRNAGLSKFKQIIGRTMRPVAGKQYSMLFFPADDSDLVAGFDKMLIEMFTQGYTPSQEITEFIEGSKSIEMKNITDSVSDRVASQLEAIERKATATAINASLKMGW